jgi:LmbE family N-acetylglucosaminyl deacetylase
MPTTEYIPRIAMSIHAHPDDQEFICAGTLAKWARAGTQIISVLLTSGESGFNDPTKDASYKTELARIREEEQRAANAVLGIQETIFLHFPDGELQHTLELRQAVTREIRRFRPEVVLCSDPTRRFYGNDYMNHPDHRVAGDVACDAVFPSAGTRLIFTDLLKEGFEPHNVKRVYLIGSENLDTWVDITATLDLKIEALRKHVSQLGDWDPAEEMRNWAAESAKRAGTDNDITHAEGFRVMVLNSEEG